MIKNKKIILFVFVIIGVLMFPFITHAETHVYNPNHREKVDWVWNKEGSPYILEENISIMASSSIRIEEGVDIMSASTSLYNILGVNIWINAHAHFIHTHFAHIFISIRLPEHIVILIESAGL